MTPLQRLAEAVLSDPARARELAAKITARTAKDQAARKARARSRPEIEAVERADGRKAAAKEDRIASLARLRVVVAARWGGRCAICREPLAYNDRPWHLHHVIGGGLRRHAESEWTCVPLCHADHHLIHDGLLSALSTLRDHAAALHLGLIVAALHKRIAKVRESRASRAQHHETKETTTP